MKYRNSALVCAVTLCLLSCNTEQKKSKEIAFAEVVEKTTTAAVSSEDANEIINAAIEAHGGSLYDEASYAFVFRKNTYTFKNQKGLYTYTSKTVKNGKEIYDVLENGNFTRTIDGAEVSLSSKYKAGYGAALNSVIYFATLPYKLNDKAVLKKYIGTTIIKGIDYKVVQVTFMQEDGGADYNDVFYYWINNTNNMIDYLAYSYATSGGGVRFRSAYNKRIVEGISFQDYINWKAPIGTALDQLPLMYEEGKLKELSRILTEDITPLK